MTTAALPPLLRLRFAALEPTLCPSLGGAIAGFRWRRPDGAMLDRLTRHVHILEMNGDSHRLSRSKRRPRHASVGTQPGDIPQA